MSSPPPTLGSLNHSQQHSYGNFVPTALPPMAQVSHPTTAGGVHNAPAQPLLHDGSLAEASYAQFRQSYQDRMMPPLNFQGRSIQRSPPSNSNTNNAPTAHMYSPPPAQLTNVLLSSSPPEVPRTTASLPNITIPRFNIGPSPVVNPHAFPVQPYGNVSSRQYAQPQVSYAQPKWAASSAHVGSSVSRSQAAGSRRPQAGTFQAPFLQFRSHEEVLAEARRKSGQGNGSIGGLLDAHHKLHDVVESNHAPFPPHESTAPSLSPAHLPSLTPVQTTVLDGWAGSNFYLAQHTRHLPTYSHDAAPQVQAQLFSNPPDVHASFSSLQGAADTIDAQQQTTSSTNNAPSQVDGSTMLPLSDVQYHSLPLPQAASLNSPRKDSGMEGSTAPRKMGRPRKPSNELKKPRCPRGKAANMSSSPTTNAISLPSAHESDADADGSVDEYFDETNYNVANGIARKAPRVSQSPKTKIKLKLNLANTSDAEFVLEPEPAPGAVPQGRPRKYQTTKPKAPPKPTTKRGRAPAKKRAPASPSKKAPLTLPASILGKAKPTQIEDIMALIEFEKDAYNANPQRQADINERNAQIKKENDSRSSKIRRAQQKVELENTPPATTRGSDRRTQAKRKVVLEDEDGEDEESSVVEAVSGRQIARNKARKTKRMGNEQVAPISVPDGDGDHIMHDDTTTAAASEVDEPYIATTPPANDDKSDTSLSDAEAGDVLKPRDHLASTVGSFHPAPGSFLFDAAGNATPNPKYRRSRRIQHVDPTPSPPSAAKNGSARKLRPRPELKDLVAMPVQQKVQYEPIALPHLVKKWREAEWDAGRYGGDAAARELVSDVVSSTALVGEKAGEALQQGVADGRLESANVEAGAHGDGDVEMSLGQERGSLGFDSEMDAEGETD